MSGPVHQLPTGSLTRRLCARIHVGICIFCFQPPIGAGTNCENKATSIERSYAHCSMFRYVLC